MATTNILPTRIVRRNTRIKARFMNDDAPAWFHGVVRAVLRRSPEEVTVRVDFDDGETVEEMALTNDQFSDDLDVEDAWCLESDDTLLLMYLMAINTPLPPETPDLPATPRSPATKRGGTCAAAATAIAAVAGAAFLMAKLAPVMDHVGPTVADWWTDALGAPMMLANATFAFM